MDQSPSPVKTRSNDLVGQIVAGKYRVTDRVAKGGMARIYRAEQLPLGRVVALKVLVPPGGDGSRILEERFLREAATCARLRHPNTVTVHDYGALDDGTFYTVMEFVEGRTLANEIRNYGPLEPGRAVRITMEILRSLQEAHTGGIVHRDLKPGNVMLVETLEGEAVKVLDFGIAKVLESIDMEAVTADGTFVGSPGYMAPEQITRKAVDGRTDLYAVGVVLYEMLSGRAPFKGSSPVQTLMSHLKEEIPPLAKVCPNPLPESLVRIVEQCTKKHIADRPASALELRRKLREVLHELGEHDDISTVSEFSFRTATLSMPPPSLPQITEERANRSVPLLLLMAVGGVLLLLFLALPLAVVAAWFATLAMRADPQSNVEPVEVAPISEEVVSSPVTVHLATEPPGARVSEAQTLIGLTPLDLVTGDTARSITLSLNGYEPVSLEVVPGDTARERLISLHRIEAPLQVKPAESTPADKPVEAKPMEAKPVATPAPFVSSTRPPAVDAPAQLEATTPPAQPEMPEPPPAPQAVP